MKGLSEFRINIERDSWSRVLVLARDDAGILRNSSIVLTLRVLKGVALMF